jgi:hypothetical protein
MKKNNGILKILFFCSYIFFTQFSCLLFTQFQQNMSSIEAYSIKLHYKTIEFSCQSTSKTCDNYEWGYNTSYTYLIILLDDISSINVINSYRHENNCTTINDETWKESILEIFTHKGHHHTIKVLNHDKKILSTIKLFMNKFRQDDNEMKNNLPPSYEK